MPAKFCGFTKTPELYFLYKFLRIFKEEEKKRNSGIIYFSTMSLICFPESSKKMRVEGMIFYKCCTKIRNYYICI